MERTIAYLFLVPYAVVFVLFVAYPIWWGILLGSSPEAYRQLFTDGIYWRSLQNTVVFLIFGANVKMLIALCLSAFFAMSGRLVRILTVLFLLPWAMPYVPALLSLKWMLNSDWGWLNILLEQLFHIEGPKWLTRTDTAFLAIVGAHIWKNLPFWTIVLVAGRLAISRDLYEAAAIDGTTRWQAFRYVTFPQIRPLFITSTLLTTIWSLGDFNSAYLLTGGGPFDRTNLLATLGIKYAFETGDLSLGVATVATALPLLLPIVVLLIIRMNKGGIP